MEETRRHAKVAEPFYGVSYKLSEGLFGANPLEVGGAPCQL